MNLSCNKYYHKPSFVEKKSKHRLQQENIMCGMQIQSLIDFFKPETAVNLECYTAAPLNNGEVELGNRKKHDNVKPHIS